VLDVFVSEKDKAAESPSMCTQFARLIGDNVSHVYTGRICRRDDASLLSWHTLLCKLKAIQAEAKLDRLRWDKSKRSAIQALDFVYHKDNTALYPVAQVSILHIALSFKLENFEVLKQLESIFEYDINCHMNSIFIVPKRFAFEATIQHLLPRIATEAQLREIRREHHDMKNLLLANQAALEKLLGGNGDRGSALPVEVALESNPAARRFSDVAFKAVRNGSSIYYTNTSTQESVWELPEGATLVGEEPVVATTKIIIGV
jgi:hypothetical protein